jgi:hypothetical protein
LSLNCMFIDNIQNVMLTWDALSWAIVTLKAALFCSVLNLI